MDFIGNEGYNIFLHLSLRSGNHPSDFKMVMRSSKMLELDRWSWNNDPNNKDRDTREHPFVKGKSFVLAIRKDVKFWELIVSVADRIVTYHWPATGNIETIRVSSGIYVNQCELYRNPNLTASTVKPAGQPTKHSISNTVTAHSLGSFSKIQPFIICLRDLSENSFVWQYQTNSPINLFAIAIQTNLNSTKL